MEYPPPQGSAPEVRTGLCLGWYQQYSRSPRRDREITSVRHPFSA